MLHHDPWQGHDGQATLGMVPEVRGRTVGLKEARGGDGARWCITGPVNWARAKPDVLQRRASRRAALRNHQRTLERERTGAEPPLACGRVQYSAFRGHGC
jgi:hypothetical protein